MRAWFVTAAEIAARQHGVVTCEQLVSAGASRSTIARASTDGRLHRLHVGVYAVGHAPRTRQARWMAAVLACGEGTVLSHRSALTAHGIRDGELPRTDVTIAPGSGRRRPGIAIHRSPLAPQDVTTRDGIPITTPERALADTARELGVDELRRAIREGLYQRRIRLHSLLDVVQRRPSRALRAATRDLTLTRSHLEDAFLRVLDDHAIERPETQALVAGKRVDFLWRQERLIVETDGWAAHGTRDAFERDRAQTNALQVAGFVVLRFTSADVLHRPAATAAAVLRARRR